MIEKDNKYLGKVLKMEPNEIAQKIRGAIHQATSYSEGEEISTKSRQNLNAELIQPLKDILEALQQNSTVVTDARNAWGTNLRQQEGKFQALYENTPIPAQSLDKDGRFINVNRAWLETLGFELNEVIGKKYKDFLHPDWKPHFENRFPIFKKQGYVHDVHFKIKHRDGHTLDILFEGVAGYTPGGEFKQTYCVFQDITKRMVAEEKLRESEAQFRRAITDSPVPIMIHDEDDYIIQLSKGWTYYSGYVLEDIPTLADWTTKAYGSAAGIEKKYIDDLFEIGETVDNGEWTITAKDGSKRVWAFQTTPLGSNAKGRRLLHSMAVDITDQKNADKRLAKYINRLEMAQEIGNIGTWNLDITNDVLEWTKQNYIIFGVEPGQPMDFEKFLAIVHPEDRDYVVRKWNQAIQGEHYDIEHRILVHGKEKWVREKAILNFDENGKATDAVGIAMDITRQKAAEEQIRKSNRRARTLAQKVISAQEDERKRISREIHDESGQLLTVLKIQLDMLYDDLPEEMESYRKQLNDATILVDNALESMRSMAQGLRPPTLDTLGLETTLENLCSGFTERLGIPISFQAEPIPEIDEITKITLYRFTQESLTNIAKHAQASAIEIELSCQENIVKLEIRDDGIGFAPDDNKSSGFGLNSMSERLELINGNLEIQSKPGKGTELIASISIPQV